MDPINYDQLKADKKIISPSDIDGNKDYFILGHYDNKRSSYQWTDYPLYLVKAADVLNLSNSVDRQKVHSNGILPTTSSTYIDIPSMTLTTKSFGAGASGNYQIFFSCNYTVGTLTSTANFILNIDGVDIIDTETTDAPNNTGVYRTNIIWQVNSLLANKVIKVKYKIISAGVDSLTLFNRVLMINGVNSLNVIL